MTVCDYYVTVAELQTHIRQHGLDTTKDSRQLVHELGEAFKCFVSVKTLLLSALYCGYSAVPCEGGKRFQFCRL